MIRSFADTTTEDIYNGVSSRHARRIPQELWGRIRRILDQLYVATDVAHLAEPPSNRLEKLKGNRAGRYSVRINSQYRVTFRFAQSDAWEVCCEDYH